MAGVVSRTSTAPLDRLRVYLIAQTKPQSVAASVKSGAVVEVAGWRAWPLVHALKDLWRAGGIRSLFAGLQAHVRRIRRASRSKAAAPSFAVSGWWNWRHGFSMFRLSLRYLEIPHAMRNRGRWSSW
ncbi:hypothetical protein CISG_02795 [Coccidioides immitis RMSCC 3703]|uniref:Uncharacterized protein n=1 Tax=Coccidioides immitis RMSCC 3703 TaxID=454286 RepID=A0A0J8U4H4_COCIT|nr:hypothetical protein CISG_02795 [Coccidioides immitis RMSCC 3703]